MDLSPISRVRHWSWDDLVVASLQRPGQWAYRPYLDGLLSLWMGFAIGSQDGNYDKFIDWLSKVRYPAQGGYRSPLTPNAMIRHAIIGTSGWELTDLDDDRAVALLATLVYEHFGLATEPGPEGTHA